MLLGLTFPLKIFTLTFLQDFIRIVRPLWAYKVHRLPPRQVELAGYSNMMSFGYMRTLTLNARLTDQSAILIPCAEATDEQVRKEIHRNCRPPPSWVTSINQEVIHRIRLSNLRIGDISISPILICFSLSD